MTLVERTVETLDRLDVSRRVFARMVGLRDSALSNILSGHSPLTPELQKRFAGALTFAIGMNENALGLPVCLHSYKRIEPLWLAFQKNLPK